MRILITGVTGFLGRHMARRLLAQGHDVTGIARHAPPEALPEGLRFVPASIEDASVTGPLLAASDWLIHLAWDTTPGSSQGLPSRESAANILPTALLLEELQSHPSCSVMFVSTGGALYPGNGEPAEETSPLLPRSYYGAAKGAVELMLQALAEQAGNRVVVLRPSNVYGPGQPAKAGFGVIPALMRCALQDQEFEVWGSGSTGRDYLYIEDFLDLAQSALSWQCEGRAFGVLNAGSGSLVSIDELCERVSGISGRPLGRRVIGARAVDPPRILLDSRRALQLLGWSARVSIGEGLALTWRWWQERT